MKRPLAAFALLSPVVGTLWFAGPASAQGVATPSIAQPAAPPRAPCASPEYRQLDFWVGEWDVEFTNPDGSIGRAENRITRDEYGDCVVTERFRQAGGGPGGGDYLGASFSIYDRHTRSWRQMWVDNMGNMFDLRGVRSPAPTTSSR